MRTTLAQARQAFNGALPNAIGACQSDLPTIAGAINRAQDMLIQAGGESGWWGGWGRATFQVCQGHPYITLPAQFCRIINMDVCRTPFRIQNEFYEFLEAGPGLQDFHDIYRGEGCRRHNWCGAFAGYERGSFPSMLDVWKENQYLQVVATDARDYGVKRILIGPAQDQNGNQIYSTDGVNQVNGFYLTLGAQPVASQMIVTNFTGIQKDITFGDVLLYQVDATTGAQVLLSRYAPWETVPSYRRYYINKMPCNCWDGRPYNPCLQPTTNVTGVPVTAMVRLEYIPVVYDTDFLIIGNIPALIEQCKANRYADMDSEKSIGFEAKCDKKAIHLLNAELTKYLGRQQPAVNFAPFGTAKLRRTMSAVRWG